MAINYLYGGVWDKGMADVLHKMAPPPQPTKAARLIAAAQQKGRSFS